MSRYGGATRPKPWAMSVRGFSSRGFAGIVAKTVAVKRGLCPQRRGSAILANESSADTGVLCFGVSFVAMNESQALFTALRQSADASVADAIERLVREAPDRSLCRINVLDFAAKTGLDEERVIAAFLHAARLGLFELSWNVLCPGCGGVLDTAASLKSVHQYEYACALCAAGYEPTLDEMVEVTFTVSPRVRKIAAHDPAQLPPPEYCRQMFWSSGVDLPEDAFERMMEEVTLELIELPAGEKALLSLTLPAEFVIVFDPVTHTAQFIDVKGEPTKERQSLALVFNRSQTPTKTVTMRPGPLRLALDNRTDMRLVPGVYVAGQALHDMLGKRKR